MAVSYLSALSKIWGDDASTAVGSALVESIIAPADPRALFLKYISSGMGLEPLQRYIRYHYALTGVDLSLQLTIQTT
jgi:hypothetical protein